MGTVTKVILVGYVGKDAELRTTSAGKAVATVSLAVNDPAKKDEQGRPGTEWYRLKIWGKTAENLTKYLLKGKQVYAEGRLSIQTWQDREGRDRYTPEVSVDQITLLGSNRDEGGGRSAQASQGAAYEAGGSDIPDDDIPF